MRIAVIHSYYSSSVPSGENVAVNLQVGALRAAGHDVLLVGRSTDKASGSKGYALRAAVTVATGIGPSPLAELNDFRPDVVHVHNLFPNFGGSWIEKCRAPIVATLHNFRAFCSAGTLWRDGKDCEACLTGGSVQAVIHRCYRQSALATAPLAVATRGRGRANPVLKYAAALVTLAPRSLQTFARARPNLCDRLHVVPNFTPDRDAASTPGDTAPWLFVGRLEPSKGIDALVEQWPESEELIVAGSGSLGGALRDIAANKPITFVGQVPGDEIDRLLRKSRALVFPSRWRESAPALTYIEALSAGRPTLAIGVNAVADDVAEARTGVAIREFSALDDGMTRLSAHLQETARTARQRFEEQYSEDSWLERMTRLYETVIPA